MSYLLRLRKWLRFHPYFATIFGGAVFLLSAVAAIFLRFPYFYATFVIGLFLFFDATAHLLDKTIAFSSGLDRIGRTFWLVLGVFIVVTDLIGGQIVFKVWEYPPYHNAINWILLYVIIYPVGGLSDIAMYRFFDLLFGRILPGNFFKVANPERIVKKILKVVFLAVPLVIVVPLALYLAGLMDDITSSWMWYGVLFVFLLAEWTFFFDTLILASGGKPVLLDLIEGSKKMILAVVITGLLGASLHELVNTYVHEWVYIAEKFPVTTASILGVPVMVFVGWIPLTIVCVQAYRFSQVVKEGYLLDGLRRVYIK